MLRTLGISKNDVLWKRDIPYRPDWRSLETVTLSTQDPQSLRILSLSTVPAHPLVIPAAAEGEIFTEKDFLSPPEHERALGVPIQKTKGVWLWKHDYWFKPSYLLWEILNKFSINSLFVTFPDAVFSSQEVEMYLEKFLTFLKQCQSRGMSVYLVKGSPEAATPVGMPEFVRRLKRIQNLLLEREADKQGLAGFQFDVEPWLLADWGTKRKQVLNQLLDLYKNLFLILNQKVDCVLPYWLGNGTFSEDQEFLNELVPYVKKITVMNYLTVRQEFYKNAERFLTWGRQKNVLINIAIENGELEAEKSEVFTKSSQGTLALICQNQKLHLLLLKNPIVTNHDSIQLFRYLQSLESDVKRTTLNGWSAVALQNFLRQFHDEYVSQQWFDGTSIHGVDGFLNPSTAPRPLQK